jgi:hypothetical protein
MTRDEVIELAMKSHVASYGPTNMCPSQFEPFIDCVEYLAKLIENATIERMALVCDEFAIEGDTYGMAYAQACSEAIRGMKT